MRLDLFLKASRLVKRRTVAREMCDAGRVLVNAREARPAKDVSQGDLITLIFSTRSVEIEVLALPPAPQKAGAGTWYRVVAEKRTENRGDPWTKNRS